MFNRKHTKNKQTRILQQYKLVKDKTFFKCVRLTKIIIKKIQIKL